MRVITFSKVFPKSHPRAGEQTFFVDKIWESIYLNGNAGWDGFSEIAAIVPSLYSHGVYEPKHHTIRAGTRWKVGDWFSPRIWSGKPYASKQIQFAPEIQIKKIWDINIQQVEGEWWVVYINGEKVGENTTDFNIDEFMEQLAKNDGLSLADFISWFSLKNDNIWYGQILCWNEEINY